MITNALTVDVVAGRSVDRLLARLQEHAATATFFVPGEIAEREPRLVRQIAAAGHEIACHGDHHEDVYRQSPAAFRADIRRAKARIEHVLGGVVIGYRAPNLSIGQAQGWAYEILLEEGFDYDSSLFPIRHDRHGPTGASRFPFEIWRDGSAVLMEFPIGTVRIFGTNLPIGGGGYFRSLPFVVTQLGMQRVNVRERQPVMFRVAGDAAKLDPLLVRFRFGSARGVLDAWARRMMPAVDPAWLHPRSQGALAG